MCFWSEFSYILKCNAGGREEEKKTLIIEKSLIENVVFVIFLNHFFIESKFLFVSKKKIQIFFIGFQFKMRDYSLYSCEIS